MNDVAGGTRIGVRRGTTIRQKRLESEQIDLWIETDLPAGVRLQEAYKDLAAGLLDLVHEEQDRIRRTGTPQCRRD